MSRKGSQKPIGDGAPKWVPMLPREVEAKVVEMAKDGVQSAVIGLRLRDSYGVPSVHDVTGKKIDQIIAEAKLTPKVPQDLANLIRRAIALQEHLSHNRNDLHNKRGLEMMEARIRKLAKYHIHRAELDPKWKYTRADARLLVD